jgi:gas vesicle protein
MFNFYQFEKMLSRSKIDITLSEKGQTNKKEMDNLKKIKEQIKENMRLNKEKEKSHQK